MTSTVINSGQIAPDGHTIAKRRRQRGLSRKTLAELIGRSDEWLRQIENGNRRLDSIECATRLADVLRLDPGSLLGLSEKQTVHHVADTSELTRSIRLTLMDSMSFLAFADQPSWWSGECHLDSSAIRAWETWLYSPHRHDKIFTQLPELLRASAARVSRTPHSASQLYSPLAVYHLARTALDKIGEHDLAWLAADRAMQIAETSGASLLRSAAGWHLAQCYLRLGHTAEASQFALSAARILSATGTPAFRDDALLCGALYLLAAEAKAACAEPHSAKDLLFKAKEISAQFPGNHHVMNVPFGTAEVGITAIDIAIRLGEIGEALRLAAITEVPDDYSIDGRLRHHLSLAYLHAKRNEDASAVFALNKAFDISPEDIRYDKNARRTLNRLLQRNNLTVRRDLERLAMNIPQ